jgi:hypothetical protein
MLKKLLTKSLSAITGVAMMLTFMPGVLYAQGAGAQLGNTARHAASLFTSSSLDSEEDVVASSGDTPLVRYAKLRRSWVVYREVGSSEIYAITSDMTKREIQTLAFFTAFDANYHIKLVQEGRLEGIDTGDPITSVDGLDPSEFRKAPLRCRLMKTADQPAVYLACGNKRRVILREGVFHRYGWEFRDVETVDQSEIDALEEDTALDESSVFDADVEIDTTATRQLRERLATRLNLQSKTRVRDRLVKAEGDSSVYLITADGTKRHIRDMAAVRAHNLNLQNVTEVTEDELEAFPDADDVTDSTSGDALNAVAE